ncbi:MAG TPA: Asp-tRNA(Asn)/Glu-tRNA(Gln) amidotransferase subunit GatC [Epsilonproteobacteria bacterium]|nr:Asp-tRNA(Asn)/Glu-tRNA(Gln) amidotransferase subunit GatC [Campylobacterota bacterium]
MQIDNAVLAKLEKLSHLHVDETKKEEIIEQLTEIVSYVENLSELDTSSLDASFSTLKGGTPMREDIPNNDPAVPKSILSHAPQSDDDFFVVPAIIE